MDMFILRPLIIALIEYSFALFSLKYGKFYPKLAATFFITLGTYQLGEFLLFSTSLDEFSVNLSFFSTTLLPPIGVYFLQKITKIQLGYALFQIVALFFALMVVIKPNIFENTDECYCFAKYAVTEDESWHQYFADYWSIYYAFSLLYAMSLSALFMVPKRFIKKRPALLHLFFAYVSFFPTSYFLVRIFDWDVGYLASIMCALAVFGAIIIFYLSMKYDKLELRD